MSLHLMNTTGYGVSMVDGQLPYVFNKIYNTKEDAIEDIADYVSQLCCEEDVNYVRRTLADFDQAKVNDLVFMLSKLDVPGRLWAIDKQNEIPVCMLTAEDIYDIGYDASQLSRADLTKIAERISEQMMPDYWTYLEAELEVHKEIKI